MASRGVSALKFVGTVSLGLLTGFSYNLTTLSLPTVLALPSATSASKAFHSLTTSAAVHLRRLTAVSSTAFLLAFVLSPRSQRHPYLLYTSVLVATSGLADRIAPYITSFISSSSSSSSTTSTSSSSSTTHARQQQQAAVASARRRAAARSSRMMEASYEVLGDVHSEGTGSASGDDPEDDPSQVLNGEEVRGEVESYLQTATVQTAVATLGFLMAVVGIWGDGAGTNVYASETIVYM